MSAPRPPGRPMPRAAPMAASPRPSPSEMRSRPAARRRRPAAGAGRRSPTDAPRRSRPRIGRAPHGRSRPAGSRAKPPGRAGHRRRELCVRGPRRRAGPVHPGRGSRPCRRAAHRHLHRPRPQQMSRLRPPKEAIAGDELVHRLRGRRRRVLRRSAGRQLEGLLDRPAGGLRGPRAGADAGPAGRPGGRVRAGQGVPSLPGPAVLQRQDPVQDALRGHRRPVLRAGRRGRVDGGGGALPDGGGPGRPVPHRGGRRAPGCRPGEAAGRDRGRRDHDRRRDAEDPATGRRRRPSSAGADAAQVALRLASLAPGRRPARSGSGAAGRLGVAVAAAADRVARPITWGRASCRDAERGAQARASLSFQTWV